MSRIVLRLPLAATREARALVLGSVITPHAVIPEPVSEIPAPPGKRD